MLQRWMNKWLVFLFCIILTACEDGSNNVEQGLVYTGKTGLAQLDGANVIDISTQLCGQSKDTSKSFKTILESLKNKMPLVDPSQCASNTGTVSSSKGVVFDDYCVVVDGHDVTINGSISGGVNIVLDPPSLSIAGSMDNLTIRSSGVIDVLFDGNLGLAASAAGGSIDIDMLIKDNITGTVFKYSNYHLSYDALDKTIIISGTISLPQFGEIDIETTDALLIDKNGIQSGELVLNKDVLGKPGAILNFSNGEIRVQGTVDPVNFSCL